MKNFISFIREQGVIGFATGFILGGAVSDLVKAFINDLISPLVGLLLGTVSGLKTRTFDVLGAQIAWGDFVIVFINFLVIAAVVYLVFRVLRLEKLDRKKD